MAALFGAPFGGLPDTEISLLYTGQSGLPFSYVYRGDQWQAQFGIRVVFGVNRQDP